MLEIHWTIDGKRITRVKLRHSLSFRMRFTQDSPLQNLIRTWICDYLGGIHSELLLPHLALTQPPFSRSVLTRAAKIPFGETLSYSDLAKSIDNPKAARAVGNALHNNPFPLIIPCHRIIRKEGIGGFAFGGGMKRMLLDFEKDFRK